jgi:hypothetical protein
MLKNMNSWCRNRICWYATRWGKRAERREAWCGGGWRIIVCEEG